MGTSNTCIRQAANANHFSALNLNWAKEKQIFIKYVSQRYRCRFYSIAGFLLVYFVFRFFCVLLPSFSMLLWFALFVGTHWRPYTKLFDSVLRCRRALIEHWSHYLTHTFNTPYSHVRTTFSHRTTWEKNITYVIKTKTQRQKRRKKIQYKKKQKKKKENKIVWMSSDERRIENFFESIRFGLFTFYKLP